MRSVKIQRFVQKIHRLTTKPLNHEAATTQHVLNSSLRKLAVLILPLASASTLFTTTVLAANNSDYRAYYGVGLGSTTGNGLRFNTLDLQAGYEFRPWMSFEGHFGGTSSDTYQENGASNSAKLEYYNSIRMRFNMVARDYRAYGFVGFTTTKISENQFTIKRAGYAYGVGIDLFGNESTALYASLGKLLDRDIDDTDTTFSQILVGFRYYLKDNYNRSRIPDRLQF